MKNRRKAQQNITEELEKGKILPLIVRLSIPLFFMLTVLGIGISIVTYLFARPIVLWFGCPLSAVEFAVSYLKIYSCGTVFVMLAQGLNPFILTQGYSVIAMSSVLLGGSH